MIVHVARIDQKLEFKGEKDNLEASRSSSKVEAVCEIETNIRLVFIPITNSRQMRA